MATKKTGTRTRDSSERSSRSASNGEGSNDSSSASSTPTKRSSAPRASAPKRMSGSAVAAAAARQLLELTGKEAEGVTSLERAEDGWKVQVEVVEVHRIPNTTDVLALYEVDVDSDGELQAYRRLRRYARGVPGEG